MRKRQLSQSSVDISANDAGHKRVKVSNPTVSGPEDRDVASQNHDDSGIRNLLDVRPQPSTRPRFKGQRVIDQAGITHLDDANSIIIAHDVLNAKEVKSYLRGASTIARFVGKSAFNAMKPRREICYTVDGEPYIYSGRRHPSQQYPPHVLAAIPRWMACVDKHLPNNCFRKLSHGIDIIYGAEFDRGGSSGAHGDNELQWGLVIIYSLGQTRYLRVRRRSNKEFINVEMPHNSVIAMHGATFQWDYTHQVDKLPPDADVHTRLTCNIRFLEGGNT